MPSAHGERVVLRILDQAQALFSLDKLNMPTRVLEDFKTVLAKPTELSGDRLQRGPVKPPPCILV